MRVWLATSRTADDRKTHVAARALDATGLWVGVACDHATCPLAQERAVDLVLRTCDPEKDPQAWCTQLLREAGAPGDVLLPMDDASTWACVQGAQQLARKFRFALPDAAALDLAHDKLELARRAGHLGISSPEVRSAENEADVGRAVHALGLPVVLKPRRGSGGLGVRVCRTEGEALRGWRERPGTRLPGLDARQMLVQAYIPGEVHDVGALVVRGDLRALLTQRRLRMEPAEAGPGVEVETTHEPQAALLAAGLLRHLDWHGPAMVELRKDARDGSFWLIEINGRFWGTLGLAVAAGLDLPTLAVRLAQGADVPRVGPLPAGIHATLPRLPAVP